MLRRIYFSFLALALLPFLASAQGVIQTVAGGGPNQLPGLSASLNFPSAVAVDKSGNVYVAVENDMRVYKIDTTGKLTVLAGNGVFGSTGDGGPATSAEFQFPSGIAVDGSGNVFISDGFASVVREVVASTGNIQAVAGNGAAGYSGDGGPAVNAGLNSPEGIAVDNSGNLFIADTSNSVVRKVVAATGNIQTVVGNGTSGYTGDGGLPTAAELQIPEAVFVDGNGNLFISDIGPNVIRKVTASSGLISTVAGNGTAGFSGDGGPATSAMLNAPFGVAADSSGNLFIADSFNAVVREVFAATGVIQTVAGNGTVGFSGNGGPATSAQLQPFLGVAVDSNANLYISDYYNLVVWEVLASNGNIQVIAGNLSATYSGDGFLPTDAELNTPQGFSLDPAGDLLIADTFNNVVRVAVASTGLIQTVAGNGYPGYAGDGGAATSAQLSNPTSVLADSAGDLFIVDQGNNVIREVVFATGNIQTIAGNGTPGYSGDGGPATSAMLALPQDLKLDASGNIFFTDSGNNVIREIVASTGIIQTVAGNGTAGYSGDNGPATSAQLSNPNGLFLDASGNIFFADSNNNVVREVVASTGIIQTVAGNGTAGYAGDGGAATSAQLNFPSGVFVDASGNLFISDDFNAVVREVVASSGNIQTVAGNGTTDFSGDGGAPLSASLDNPFYLASGPSGSYFVSDDTMRIRQVNPNTTTPAPSAQLSATSLTFTSNVGVASAAQPVTLSNTGTATLAISNIAITGINSGDFSQSNNCGSSVAAGSSCTINVKYDPAASGSSSASVTITDNSGSGTQLVALAGTVSNAAPSAQLSATSLTFSANAGATSAAQAVTLTNNGSAALTITGIAVGGTNSANFSQSNTCGSSVAAGANCTISVTFKPTASGASSASVTVSDNAGGSPQSVALTGNAADFSLALANGGSNSATVQPGGNATYNLTTTPTGAYTGSVTLTCTGTPAAATCSVTPSTLTFSGNSAAAFSVGVTTTAPKSAAAPFLIHWPRVPYVPVGLPVTAALLLALAAALAVGSRSRSTRIWVPAMALLLCLGLLSGCGSSSSHSGNNGRQGTPVGTYTLTITATPQQGMSHSTTVTLVVQ